MCALSECHVVSGAGLSEVPHQYVPQAEPETFGERLRTQNVTRPSVVTARVRWVRYIRGVCLYIRVRACVRTGSSDA